MAAVEHSIIGRVNPIFSEHVIMILLCQVQRTRLMQGKSPLEGLPIVQEPETGVRPATTVRFLACTRPHTISFIPSSSLGHS